MVSLVGIHEQEQGCIDYLISQLRENKFIDPDLLAKINLLIYDQLKTNEPFGIISLKEVFESNGKEKWFYLRVFAKQEALHNPLEKRIESEFHHDIASQRFHRDLMSVGNTVFNAN
jgi:hypothetical protein